MTLFNTYVAIKKENSMPSTQSIDANEIEKFDCTIFSSDDKFGLIGASAAIAWTPNDNSTWELISWRDDSMIGKTRILDVSKINNLDSIHPNTFMNRDPTKNKGLIAPRTPCPVLYGIRGISPIDVEKAHIWLQSDQRYEQCIDFKIFKTNQLSDDHVTPSWGSVISRSTTVQGAHSFISVYSDKKNLTLVAFQEGGPVNTLLRYLMPGDIVCWTGLCSPMDNSIAISDDGLIVSVANTTIQFKTTGGGTFYSNSIIDFIDDPSISYVCDPVVNYDPEEDRFIFFAQECSGNSSNSHLIIMFSETNDPDEGWNYYKITGNPLGDNSWFDYPKLAISDTELFISGNLFYNGGGFNQSVVYQMEKFVLLVKQENQIY